MLCDTSSINKSDIANKNNLKHNFLNEGDNCGDGLRNSMDCALRSKTVTPMTKTHGVAGSGVCLIATILNAILLHAFLSSTRSFK